MAEMIKIYEENPNSSDIKKVVSVLRKGGLIIYPSDTVYALGCDISNYKALEKLARIKEVKLEKANFSFVCDSISNISDYVNHISTPTFKILKRSLPGPYTFILQGNNNLPKAFKKKKEVGIRVPKNEIALAIVRELGNPIASTSIYDEDEIIEYTTDPELIYQQYKNQVDLIIDGGYGDNQASTVLDYSGKELKIVREGKGEINNFL